MCLPLFLSARTTTQRLWVHNAVSAVSGLAFPSPPCITNHTHPSPPKPSHPSPPDIISPLTFPHSLTHSSSLIPSPPLITSPQLLTPLQPLALHLPHSIISLHPLTPHPITSSHSFSPVTSCHLRSPPLIHHLPSSLHLPSLRDLCSSTHFLSFLPTSSPIISSPLLAH